LSRGSVNYLRLNAFGGLLGVAELVHGRLRSPASGCIPTIHGGYAPRYDHMDWGDRVKLGARTEIKAGAIVE